MNSLVVQTKIAYLTDSRKWLGAEKSAHRVGNEI
jgi:hypothetical protein